jgi:hypothetical protein
MEFWVGIGATGKSLITCTNKGIMKTIFTLIVIFVLGCQLQAQVFILSSSPGGFNGPNMIAAADVNGDGKVDLICANYSGNSLSVLTNTGSGNFVLSGTYAVGNNPVPVVAADVNGDGKVDLICANLSDNTLSVLTNNGNGNFVLSGTYAVGSNPAWVAAADVNGDGKVDLISANYGSSSLSVLTNTGNGGFALSTTYVVGNNPSWIGAADVNGDGKVDLICGQNQPNAVSVLTNNGSGSFVLASSLTINSEHNSFALGDVNGDGKVDLISANASLNSLSVLTNAGSGYFAMSGTYAVGSRPYLVTTADVNGDGKMDLISANVNDNTLSVLTNDGSGGFVTAGTFAVGHSPYFLTAADVNGDGKVDLISANTADNTLSILTNAYEPVTINSEPMSQVVPFGGTATFTVIASGLPAPTYQWTFNGTNLIGQTSNTLTITNVDLPNLGNYQALINNGNSTTNSDIVTLNMSPSLDSPFAGATTIWGKDATLSVGAIGSGQLSYQWYLNGVAIAEQTGATLNFTSIQFTNAGLYSVVVSSPYGSVTNAAYQVVVNPANISIGLYPGVTISGVAGYSYIIQSSTNLGNTNGWVIQTNLTLTQPVQLWIDTTVNASLPNNPQYFYQILPGQ